MVTCYLRYIIDPFKLKEFESYGKSWIPLVEKFGGKHHGYFLPSEGANNVALAMFTFPNLALHKEYRTKSPQDPEYLPAFKHTEEARYIINYERSFFRPVFEQKNHPISQAGSPHALHDPIHCLAMRNIRFALLTLIP